MATQFQSFDLFDRMLDALNTATWLDDAVVKLFTNDVDVGPDTVIADLVEADYTGYADQPLVVTFNTFSGMTGDWVASYPHLVFQPTGSTVTNTVQGFWVEGTAGGVGVRLLWVVKFAEPMPMVGVQSVIIVEPRFIVAQPHDGSVTSGIA